MTKYITAGVSRNNKGVWKVRYSTLNIDDTMFRQMKADNTDNFYVDLPHPMERDAVAAYLLTLEDFSGNADRRSVLEATVAKKAPRAAKPTKMAKAVVGAAVKTAAKTKQSLAA
jgi:hypothetical protein